MDVAMQESLWSLLLILGKIGLIIAVILGAVAYLTYFERKVLASMQLRRGPNVVGPFGLLQPIADGIKLLSKETIIPSGSNAVLFLLAPVLSFLLALSAWSVIPFSAQMVLANINVGVLYLFAISSLGVYGIIIAGWASNSKYAFLGGLRSAAQMVSYEVSIGLVIISVLLVTGSLNLTEIVTAERSLTAQLLLLPMLVVFFISALAETNRAPFDLPEGESELVGGFNVEYSSMTFALFFLAEYANMILMSALITILFLGGWYPPFSFILPEAVLSLLSFVPAPIWFAAKIVFCLFVFIWVRGTLPRFRYDQLMRLGWKVFLPFSLFWLVLMASVLFFTQQLPGQS